jgi:hypothetical protein
LPTRNESESETEFMFVATHLNRFVADYFVKQS